MDTVKFDRQKVLCMDFFELIEVGVAGKGVDVGGKKELVLVVKKSWCWW